jgi:orotate phosphoribosyltransferase
MRITDTNEISRLFVAGEDEAVDHDLAAMIARTGALLRGHFRLESGLHSEYSPRFGQLAFRRGDAEEIALKCLDALPERPTNPIVLTVETAPRYLAQALGDRLHASVSIAKANAERHPTTKGVEPSGLDGRDVRVVADVLSSGESIRPLVELAKQRDDRDPDVAGGPVAVATL